MDLSRMTEYVTLVGGFKGEPFSFYAEISKPTIKEFVSSGVPSDETTISFLTWFEASKRIETKSKLNWRGVIYEVVEIQPDYGRQDYTIIKCRDTSLVGKKNPFSTY